MAESRKKDPEFKTPRLVWRFPKIDKPDYGTKEFPKPKGEYSIQAIAKADDPLIKAFLDKLKPLYEQAISEGKDAFAKLKVDSRKKLQKDNGKEGIKVNDLFTALYDQETEEPTGEIVFKFAMAASGERKDKSKWTAKPRVFDAKGQPITTIPEIWSGSEGIVAFSARPYFIPGTGAVGLKLRLQAAQLLKLVQGGGRDAAGYGFGEEDGYAHDDSNTDEKSGEGSTEETTDDVGEKAEGEEDF